MVLMVVEEVYLLLLKVEGEVEEVSFQLEGEEVVNYLEMVVEGEVANLLILEVEEAVVVDPLNLEEVVEVSFLPLIVVPYFVLAFS